MAFDQIADFQEKWIFVQVINVSMTSSVKQANHPSMLSAFKAKAGLMLTIKEYDVPGSYGTYLFLTPPGSWNVYLLQS